MSKIEVPELPYPKDALAPHISARTVDVHYEKHHKGYLRKLLAIVRDKPEAQQDLETLIRGSDGNLFNNAAQVWNHTFYWRSMKPGGGGDPTGQLRDLIAQAFGSVGDFKKEFAEAANGEFGSGWAWLVKDANGRLRVLNSSDAENPLQHDQVPLLTLDVWEHAYYLDYQHERDRYVSGFLDHLINWDFVTVNLEKGNPAVPGPRS
jgi:Fe-Mn family superoxide dismutase